jgi:lantibiotic biosynthesis protein
VQRIMAPYRNAGFFMLRTPLLPYASFFELSDGVRDRRDERDREDLSDAQLADELAGERRRVLSSLARAREFAAVREALFVASADLHEAMDQWERGALGDDAERKALHALYRYVARMSTRSTPFGLFAGSSIGTLERRSNLALAGRDAYRRFTLLDNSYLFLLFQEINADPAYRAVATYRPNSGLYRAGASLRYAETLVEQEDGTMGHQLASVERDECIDLVLELARDGATVPSLIARLVDACRVSAEAAAEYLDGLIDNQILVSELTLAVTGPDPLQDAIAQIAVHPDPRLGRVLSRVRQGLEDLDTAGVGRTRRSYDEIAVELRELPVENIEASRLFQVDLWKPLVGDALGSQVVSDVRMAIAQLYRIAPSPPRTELDRMREAFSQRYGDRSVPLTMAIDPELGIAARETSLASEATGLLEGLTFDEPSPADRVEFDALPERDLFLLDKLRGVWRGGKHELVLEEEDLQELEVADKHPLPPSFAAWFQIARRGGRGAPGDDEHEILFSTAMGPPGTRLLGRFAHGSARLTALMRDLAAQEAMSQPDAVLTEIVHLPFGRSGNVVCRPSVHEFEIPYLGKSGVPRSRQIPLDDLWLRIERGRFVLESRALGRPVLPTLTCAHNIANNTVPLYRFLARLPHQDCYSWVMWRWGAFLRASHLPRVRIGPVIVGRESWNLKRRDLEPLGAKSPVARYRQVRALRDRYDLPRHVSLSDSDNELAFDLENPVSIDVLADMVKSRPRARLVELWPGRDDAGVDGPEGRYTNEIILPFVRQADARADARDGASRAAPRAAASAGSAASASRAFGPGSEWLRAVLITSRSFADQVLVRSLGDELAGLSRERVCDLWYFDVAVASGQWQIALNLHGEPDRLVAAALPRLGRALEPLLVDGTIRTWAVETYVLEASRCGGERAMPDALALFAHDSAAALELMRALRGGDEDDRWQLALMSVHRLLADLAPDPGERGAAVGTLRSARLAALPVTGKIEGELARAHRAHGAQVRSVLEQEVAAGALGDARAILDDRSRGLEPVCASLRLLRQGGELTCPWPVLLARFAEGAAQRLLRPAAAAHELVIYDHLGRLYRSEAARNRLGLGAGPRAGAGPVPRRAHR